MVEYNRILISLVVTMTYPEQLNIIGLTILEPFTTAKAKHRLKCNTCKHEWFATPISKIQSNKKYGGNGCPNCTTRNKQQVLQATRESAKLKLMELGFQLVGDWDGSQSTTTKILVRNVTCGHEFESASGNLLHRKVTCPTCNLVVKQFRCTARNNAIHHKYLETAAEWESYKSKVQSLSRLAYKLHHITINPLNLPRGLAGTEGAYQVDHIVSVRWCFDNGVPEELCAHHTNLQMLTWRENNTARARIKEGIDPPVILAPYFD